MNLKRFSQQVKMARAVLDWTAQTLAERAGVSEESISKVEKADPKVLPAIWRSIQQALEHSGIEFLAGGGVNLHESVENVAVVADPDMPAGARLIWPS